MESKIRPVTLEQLDSIIKIERLSYSTPWPASVFIEELQQKWSHLWGYYFSGFREPVGFILFWEVYDELHILNLAVHPSFRRRRVARKLLEHLIEYGKKGGFRYLTLEVRRSNVAAINLYRSLGLKTVSIRKGYYSDNNEDALIMALEISPPTEAASVGKVAAEGSRP